MNSKKFYKINMRMVNPIKMMIDKKKMRYNIKLSSSLDIIT